MNFELLTLYVVTSMTSDHGIVCIDQRDERTPSGPIRNRSPSSNSCLISSATIQMNIKTMTHDPTIRMAGGSPYQSGNSPKAPMFHKPSVKNTKFVRMKNTITGRDGYATNVFTTAPFDTNVTLHLRYRLDYDDRHCGHASLSRSFAAASTLRRSSCFSATASSMMDLAVSDCFAFQRSASIISPFSAM